MRYVQPSGRLRPFGLQLTAFPAAALFVTLTALTCTPGYAQDSTETVITPGPLITVQYEDRLASETQALKVVLPLPSIEIDRVDYRSDDCLDQAGSVAVAAPDPTLRIELALPPPPPGEEVQGSCNSAVTLLFVHGERSWPAQANIAVTRLPDLPELSHDEVSTTFIADLIAIPQHLQPSHSTTLVLLSITNRTTAPFTLLGFGNTAIFTSVIGPVYRYDPNSFTGTYESLLESAQPLEAASLAPGEAAHLAIIYDPDRRLPDAAGVVTIRPVALVESAEQLFVVPFPHLSSAWGPELR